MIEADIRTFLLAQPTITSLVNHRIFGLLRGQGADLPAIMIQRITSARNPTFCATSKLVDASVQVDAYALGGEQAWTIAAELRRLLLDFSGMMAATRVRKILLANEFPMMDPDPGVIRVTQTYNLWYLED